NNQSWKKGGCLYSNGENCYQRLSEAERVKMTINGEPVAEIDIKASFLTIYQALLKQPLRGTGDPSAPDRATLINPAPTAQGIDPKPRGLDILVIDDPLAVRTARSWRGIVPFTHLAREGRMTVTIGRRELLAARGGAAVGWPLAARAQQHKMCA